MILIGLVMVFAVSAANAGSMALNFSGTAGSSWTISGTAGAPGYAQAYWTNTISDWTGQSSWGAQYNLVDNTGAATGAKMEWYASSIGTWAWGLPTGNDNVRMMDAGIATVLGTDPIRVHAIQIPYASYDVVVYFTSENTNAYVAKYTVGSTSVYAQTPAEPHFVNGNVFTEVPTTSTANLQYNTPAGNYIVFKGLAGSTLDITAEAIWAGTNVYTGANGVAYASISGFQIIETPEPATLTLLGMGLLSVLKRNRK